MSTGSISRLSRGEYIDWWRHWNVETARFTREQLLTFMMCDNPMWDFKFATWRKVAWSRLEEKERFFWNGVAQFLGVRSIVSPNGNDLRRVIKFFTFTFFKAYFLSVSNEGSHSRVPSAQNKRNWMLPGSTIVSLSHIANTKRHGMFQVITGSVSNILYHPWHETLRNCHIHTRN